MRQTVERIAAMVSTAHSLGAGPADELAILWRLTKNARAGLGLALHRPARRYTLRTVVGTLHLRDNFGDVTNLVSVLHRNVYRARPLARPGAIFDVGANIGLASMLFARHNPGRPVHCFEPLDDNAALIALNCPAAHVVRAAVGAEAGRVTLAVDPDRIMASAVACRWPTSPAEFPVTTLDAYCSAGDIGPIALLKIDAEGMEGEILAGAPRTLSRTAEVVVETHGPDRHARVRSMLEQAGFVITDDQSAATTGMLYARGPERA